MVVLRRPGRKILGMVGGEINPVTLRGRHGLFHRLLLGNILTNATPQRRTLENARRATKNRMDSPSF
jgi:hypothetical protein